MISEEPPERPKRGRLAVLFGVGFVVLGMLLAFMEKAVYQLEAFGSASYGYHKFRKPWFFSSIAFVGMSLSVLVYIVFTNTSRERYPPISQVSASVYLEFAVPAVFDLFQGIMSSITTIYVGVSVDYMMRGGTILGLAMILSLKLNETFKPTEWLGMGIVTFSLMLVGASSIINAGHSSTVLLSPGWTSLVIVLKCVSQIAYAIKLSYEQYFTHNRKFHPVLVVGLEGSWSAYMILCLCMPIVNAMPGDEGNGVHEDIIDTFTMISNNPTILAVCLCAVVTYMVYNICSVMLTELTSAVVRSMVESFRTCLIWVSQLALFYTIRRRPQFADLHGIGEEWNSGSWLQLAGYILMTLGLLHFRGDPKWPCLRDPVRDTYVPLQSN